jgi:hypothetical protein
MKKTNLSSILLLSVIVVLTWGENIHAEIWSASNPADFQLRLTQAQESSEETTIQLEPGIYDLSSGELTYEVAGGGNLIIEPANSGSVILDGGAASRILKITNTDGSNEVITITGITFQNAISTALNASAPEIKIKNCKFIDNTPDFDLSPATRLGGGAELRGKVTLTNNLFEGNFGSPDMCGGATILGGPIELDKNIFVGNGGGGPYQSLNGGGVCIRPSLFSPDPQNPIEYNDIILTNNVFDANTCSSFYGCPGGLYVAQTSGVPPRIIITNNTFINNTALQAGATAGAAVGIFTGSLDIHNNIFWNNLDSSYPQVVRDLAAAIPEIVTLNVTYNLFSNNESQVWTTPFGSPITPYLGCEGEGCDTNHYNEDPILTAGYHLTGDSPAKDSGDNSAPGRPDWDFEDDIRPSTTEDTVDIGADEFTPPQPNISVSPPTLVFPYIVVMQSSIALDVVISNIGAAALSITEISITDTTNFSLAPGTCGISVTPGGSCTALVTFSPQTVGDFNASLTINSTDPDSPSKVVSLSGNGDADTDGDGIGNNADPDDDNDGLPDAVEENILGTDPLQNDTDGNGTPDGDEDNDGDGFTNIEEVQCASDPGDPSSRCAMGFPWLMLLLD